MSVSATRRNMTTTRLSGYSPQSRQTTDDNLVLLTLVCRRQDLQYLITLLRRRPTRLRYPLLEPHGFTAITVRKTAPELGASKTFTLFPMEQL